MTHEEFLREYAALLMPGAFIVDVVDDGDGPYLHVSMNDREFTVRIAELDAEDIS